MKKLTLIAILLFSFNLVSSQSCLPEGIIFETQAQIDSFQINYPGCVEIEGNVEIGYTWLSDVTNLDGLNMLISTGGDLVIINNPVLLSLEGLEGVTSIGGNLIIMNNALTCLAGMDNVTSVEGDLWIESNGTLTYLSELENLTYIGGSLKIYYNDALVNMTGLEGVTSIGGDIEIGFNDALMNLSGLQGMTTTGDLGIFYNDALSSLTGLENLTSIGSELLIKYNVVLTSLAGLENVNSNTIQNLDIYGNDMLSSCVVQSICEYLASPNGSVSIYDNADGCNNPGEIASACGFVMPCLPYGNYYFYSQPDVDSFHSIYPGCTDLEGQVWIASGDDIFNLNGLNVLTSIAGDLYLYENNALSSLSGLDNLTFIGGSLYFEDNDALTSLTGLEGLNSIEGSLSLYGNDALTTMAGLEGLTWIGEYLNIGFPYIPSYGNAVLKSLTGIDNIDANSIETLTIANNPLLSTCEVESVCAYLASPNGNISICGNAIGCNSPEEVLDSCEANAVKIDEQYFKNNLFLYPNPASRELNISAEGYAIDEVIIYTLTGQQVFAIRPKSETIDISSLPPGMYIVEVMVEGKKVREKVVVE
jgi:hypothetical protein